MIIFFNDYAEMGARMKFEKRQDRRQEFAKKENQDKNN